VAIRRADGASESAPQFAPLPRGDAASDTLRYGAQWRGKD
jgi:hypothetical protein